MIHDGHPYCEKDYLVAFGHKCQGCGKYIKGSFIGALGGDWHKDCFVCTVSSGCAIAGIILTFTV